MIEGVASGKPAAKDDWSFSMRKVDLNLESLCQLRYLVTPGHSNRMGLYSNQTLLKAREVVRTISFRPPRVPCLTVAPNTSCGAENRL
ncbi:hypothetical protein M407DRAFT_97127 [Tulasnella calospora MUT 4182]|uniref:Uncharacterized protein n=1 Tax=Tulasnella calospora MUT 4182 TaxID=1051891 RepID=A0A0C3Q6G6_9AGAM|nr:hypothetical protein M407DRAFT_97127 [Tulasnella calospora MUT 4182]